MIFIKKEDLKTQINVKDNLIGIMRVGNKEGNMVVLLHIQI